jgi:ADP-ribosyl-[dinitrogen reductase] hydrolase
MTTRFAQLHPARVGMGGKVSANREFLEHLFATQGIAVQRGALFSRAPGPMPQAWDFERAAGMMLGLAIGDALGNTSESQSPADRRARYGEIRDYLPNRYAERRPVGLPSDDTQLAFWTLEQMLADGELNMEHVADRFCREQIFGIGQAVGTFLRHYEAGAPWYRSGPPSAGNGALMRIAPVVFPHLHTGTPDLWVDTALLAMLTHNDAASISACLAFTGMLWELLQMDAPPSPSWWVETYAATAQDLEGATHYRPRGGAFTDYDGPVWRFVETYVSAAYRADLPTLEACNRWYSGAFLLETTPSVLYILMRYADDPEEAIVRAVNDTRDNDTAAAIVGAAVGALYGRSRLPERWVASLLGRTGAQDDGRIFELLEAARSRWWANGS